MPPFCADEPIKVYGLVLNASPSVPRSFPRAAKELIALLLRPQFDVELLEAVPECKAVRTSRKARQASTHGASHATVSRVYRCRGW